MPRSATRRNTHTQSADDNTCIRLLQALTRVCLPTAPSLSMTPSEGRRVDERIQGHLS